jgi:hypothetical protein
VKSEFKPFFDALHEDLKGEPMELFEQYIYYGNNCTVIFVMEPDGTDKSLQLQVIAGVPRYVDVTCDFFAPAAEDV